MLKELHCEAVVCLEPLMVKSECHLSGDVNLCLLMPQGQLLNIKENGMNGNVISAFANDS